MSATMTRPPAAKPVRSPSESDRLSSELEELRAGPLAEFARLKAQPVELFRARMRASMIRSRLERIERERVAEEHDPRWRAKLAEAEAEYTAAKIAKDARMAIRTARGRHQQHALLDDHSTLNGTGGAIVGVSSAMMKGAVFLPPSAPEDQMVEARLSAARLRLRLLREWPNELARGLEASALLARGRKRPASDPHNPYQSPREPRPSIRERIAARRAKRASEDADEAGSS